MAALVMDRVALQQPGRGHLRWRTARYRRKATFIPEVDFIYSQSFL